MSNDRFPSENFRRYLPDLNAPRFTALAKQDAHEYARGFLEDGQPPWLFALWQHWRRLFAEPFRGVTSDGTVQPDLYSLEDEGIDIDSIVTAAETLLYSCSPVQRQKLCYHVDSPEWRSWSNPEFLLSNKGLRLDEVPSPILTAALSLLAASTSPEGYAKALGAMRINGFLGSLVNGRRVMNEHSYNIVLFGTPSPVRPWGWQLYGHHLCLNFFFHRRQLIATPWFTGAEPNTIDHGPYKGTRILHREEALGLELMRSLPPALQRRAQTYAQLRDPAMPPGRWNRDDQRHLCGAYRDNRVVPYEGVRVTEMPDSQVQELVWQIAEQYLLYLPLPARRAHMARLRRFADETWFSWIGGYDAGVNGNSGDDGDDGDASLPAFYFRIQSPVAIFEFDHHSGVFLTNDEPARFHIHTICRTPNSGDYGMALRRLIPAVEDCFVFESG